MDTSSFFQSLYKTKFVPKQNKTKSDGQETRRLQRNTCIDSRRKIGNLTPVQDTIKKAPAQKNNKVSKKQTEKSLILKKLQEERLEKLKQWQMKRDQKKEEDKKRKKPLFIVPSSAKLPSMRSMYSRENKENMNITDCINLNVPDNFQFTFKLSPPPKPRKKLVVEVSTRVTRSQSKNITTVQPSKTTKTQIKVAPKGRSVKFGKVELSEGKENSADDERTDDHLINKFAAGATPGGKRKVSNSRFKNISTSQQEVKTKRNIYKAKNELFSKPVEILSPPEKKPTSERKRKASTLHNFTSDEETVVPTKGQQNEIQSDISKNIETPNQKINFVDNNRYERKTPTLRKEIKHSSTKALKSEPNATKHSVDKRCNEQVKVLVEETLVKSTPKEHKTPNSTNKRSIRKSISTPANVYNTPEISKKAPLNLLLTINQENSSIDEENIENKPKRKSARINLVSKVSPNISNKESPKTPLIEDNLIDCNENIKSNLKNRRKSVRTTVVSSSKHEVIETINFVNEVTTPKEILQFVFNDQGKSTRKSVKIKNDTTPIVPKQAFSASSKKRSRESKKIESLQDDKKSCTITRSSTRNSLFSPEVRTPKQSDEDVCIILDTPEVKIEHNETPKASTKSSVSKKKSRKSEVIYDLENNANVANLESTNTITPVMNKNKRLSENGLLSTTINTSLIKTPENTTPSPINYRSPFVVHSRGKQNANKEWLERRDAEMRKTLETPLDDNEKQGAAYFRKLLDNEIIRLRKMCTVWEMVKNHSLPLPDGAVDMIDTVIGQTNLLITKKFEQFRGLIDSFEFGTAEKRVLCEDLHGFWDMVFMQVENLDKRFENLDKMKTNNWEEIQPDNRTTKNIKAKKVPVSKPKTKTTVSNVRSHIAALRKQQQQQGKKTPRKSISNVEVTPLKSILKQTPRKSILKSVLKSEASKRTSSPGLIMAAVTNAAKRISSSPVANKSTKRKTVLFKENDFINFTP